MSEIAKIRAPAILETAIELAPYGIVVTDALAEDNPIIYANQAYLALSGHKSEEVLGRNPRFMHGEDTDQPGLTEIRAAIREGRSVSTDIRNYRKDSSVYICEVTIKPIYDQGGQLTNWIGLQKDITAQVMLFQKESEMIRQKEEFLALLMHDIKNPLLGNNQVLKHLLTGVLGGLNDNQLRVITALCSSNQALLDLIYQSIEQYKAESEDHFISDSNTSVDASIAMSSCLEEYSAFLCSMRHHVNLTWEVSRTAVARVPGVIFRRIVQNLLDNAIKYTPDRGSIHVTLKQEDELILIEVTNTGTPIPEEELRTVFERFNKGSKNKGDPGSIGLGLYACKRLLDRYEGTIKLDSNDGKTRILLTLPSSPVQQGHAAT